MEKVEEALVRGSESKPKSPSEQINNKLWTAWGAGRAYAGGVVNQWKTGDIFYDSLFHPDQIDPKILLMIKDKDKLILQEPLQAVLKEEVPSKDEFIKKYRHVMTQEVAFEKAYFPGAKDAIKEMLEYGPAWIWTTGDVHGAEIASGKLPGSHEQLKRLARGGFGQIKRDLKGKQHKLGIIADENKLKFLKDVVFASEENHDRQVVIIDDKVQNLMDASSYIRGILLEFFSFNIVPILILDRECEKYGTPSDNLGKLPRGFQGTVEDAIADANQQGYIMGQISSLKELVGELKKGKDGQIFSPEARKTHVFDGAIDLRRTAFVVDHDDVISIDNERTRLQQEAILGWLGKQILQLTE
ncbi:hypothetical protein HYT32_02115 [Candidatus Roizmanbacteria bacterium]|nr:hypothetical protein [Candidatus Roizmanbacteria bacterium]